MLSVIVNELGHVVGRDHEDEAVTDKFLSAGKLHTWGDESLLADPADLGEALHGQVLTPLVVDNYFGMT